MKIVFRLLGDSLTSGKSKVLTPIGFIGTIAGIFKGVVELIPDASKWGFYAKAALLLGIFVVVGVLFFVVLTFVALKRSYRRAPDDLDPHQQLCKLDCVFRPKSAACSGPCRPAVPGDAGHPTERRMTLDSPRPGVSCLEPTPGGTLWPLSDYPCVPRARSSA